MKCSACSAENVLAAVHCEYCGTVLGSKQTNVYSDEASSASGRVGFSDFIPQQNDPAFHLWNSTLPTSKFNWWAFLFPVAYLGGYGAKKSAVAAGVTLIAGAIIFNIIFRLMGYRSHQLVYLGLLAFILIYSYKVATHSDSLIVRKTEFNWPMAIGLQFVYILLNGIFG